MASINLAFLRESPKIDDHVYKDIHFDLEQNYTRGTELSKKLEIKDLRPDYDLNAVKNSLFNLFTTLPGQKILNPVYGLNLMQFVFTNLNETNARLIGKVILEGTELFEPRVTILNINVEVDYDQSQYTITMRINVPTLNLSNVSIKGVLKDSGFYFV
jgi:phage baseplate assembly protein W